MLRCNKEKLSAFAQTSLTSDLTYHRTRKILWEQFTKMLKEGREDHKDTTFTFTFSLFNSIKSALTCRSESLTDEKRLAFETAVQTIFEELAEDDADEDEEKEQSKALAAEKH